MTTITDEQMRERLATTKAYTVVILTTGPNRSTETTPSLIWEHGRRNFALRAEGLLPVVCPVTDDTDICGIGVLNTDIDQARTIMDTDPAVAAGVFTYQLHPCRSFPGDALLS